MRRRALVGLALVSAAVLGPAAAAHAQCGPAISLEDGLARAHVAFVGTVIDRSNRDRTAVFEVLEVWKGSSLPGRVIVNGGPADRDQLTSVDRSWLLNQIYLVVPANEHSPFQDSLCTATRLWSTPTGEIPEHLQPAVGNALPLPMLASAGAAGGEGGTGRFLDSVVLAGVVLVVALGFVWLVSRLSSRRRHAATQAAVVPVSDQVSGAFRRRRFRWLIPSLPRIIPSRRGTPLERVRKSRRRGRRGGAGHDKEQLLRAVKTSATRPPSRKNHYTSGRRSVP